jgi:hypothetical protein
VQPSSGRGVDEATGWFLDYFSPGELRRYLKRGASAPMRDVRLAAAASIGIALITAAITIERMRALASDPGAIASMCVVASGFALAVFIFHLLRLGAARRLASGAITPEQVRAHLDESRMSAAVAVSASAAG